MARYTGSEDVYDELVKEFSDNWLCGLLAFALVEEHKIEWMKHHAEYGGVPATDAQVKSWYEALPEGVLSRAKSMAVSTLEAYVEDIELGLTESIRRGVEQSVVLGEIRQVRRFWPQFGTSVAAGMVSSLLFGALLFALAFLVLNDRSPVSIGASISSMLGEEKSHDH